VVNKGFSGVVALPKTSGVSIMRHLMDSFIGCFPGAGHGSKDSAGKLRERMTRLTGQRHHSLRWHPRPLQPESAKSCEGVHTRIISFEASCVSVAQRQHAGWISDQPGLCPGFLVIEDPGLARLRRPQDTALAGGRRSPVDLSPKLSPSLSPKPDATRRNNGVPPAVLTSPDTVVQTPRPRHWPRHRQGRS
jgi:hypothetical protein